MKIKNFSTANLKKLLSTASALILATGGVSCGTTEITKTSESSTGGTTIEYETDKKPNSDTTRTNNIITTIATMVENKIISGTTKYTNEFDNIENKPEIDINTENKKQEPTTEKNGKNTTLSEKVTSTKIFTNKTDNTNKSTTKKMDNQEKQSNTTKKVTEKQSANTTKKVTTARQTTKKIVTTTQKITEPPRTEPPVTQPPVTEPPVQSYDFTWENITKSPEVFNFMAEELRNDIERGSRIVNVVNYNGDFLNCYDNYDEIQTICILGSKVMLYLLNDELNYEYSLSEIFNGYNSDDIWNACSYSYNIFGWEPGVKDVNWNKYTNDENAKYLNRLQNAVQAAKNGDNTEINATVIPFLQSDECPNPVLFLATVGACCNNDYLPDDYQMILNDTPSGAVDYVDCDSIYKLTR